MEYQVKTLKPTEPGELSFVTYFTRFYFKKLFDVTFGLRDRIELKMCTFNAHSLFELPPLKAGTLSNILWVNKTF